jgi:hypothetical protein
VRLTRGTLLYVIVAVCYVGAGPLEQVGLKGLVGRRLGEPEGKAWGALVNLANWVKAQPR